MKQKIIAGLMCLFCLYSCAELTTESTTSSLITTHTSIENTTASSGTVISQTTTNETTQSTTDTEILTPFEIVQRVKTELDLGVDLDAVKDNMVLPKTIIYGDQIVLVTWNSSNKAILNNEGNVFRPSAPNGNVSLTLTAYFSLAGTIDYQDFNITVTEIPSGDLALVEEATASLVLWPEPKLDCDFLVLPRVGDFATHIDWSSSHPEWIDLEGNVTLPEWGQPDRNVTLSATISLGEAMMFRDYQVTLTAKDPFAGIPITLTDSRILRIVPVSDKIAMLSAILNAQPGDAIVIENGIYYDVNFTMTHSGTKTNPIFIMARNPGRVYVKGESQFHINADHVILANLTFTEGRPSSDQGGVILNGDHLRLTNTLIDKFDTAGYDYKWVSLIGQHHEVDNNTFDGKQTGGSLLTIWRNDLSPQFHTIHHNQFLNYKDAGGANGYETIRVGTSTYSQSDAYVVIENNRFDSVNGEIEIISIKSGRVLVRANTFIDSLGHVTCRHGKNNVIESNLFFGNDLVDTGGIRAYDGGHIIRNNYIDSIYTSSNTRGGIVIHSGVNIPGTDTVMNAQWTSFYMLIIGNTFVNCRQSILFDGKYSYPAYDPILINNLVVSRPGYAATRYDKLPIGAIFEDNHFFSDTAYAAGGAVVSVTIPDGVDYANGTLSLEATADGLYLHDQLGAQNLTLITEATSGVSWRQGVDD
jgi:poly(beta-D-mannuronate) lyase